MGGRGIGSDGPHGDDRVRVDRGRGGDIMVGAAKRHGQNSGCGERREQPENSRDSRGLHLGENLTDVHGTSRADVGPTPRATGEG